MNKMVNITSNRFWNAVRTSRDRGCVERVSKHIGTGVVPAPDQVPGEEPIVLINSWEVLEDAYNCIGDQPGYEIVSLITVIASAKKKLRASWVAMGGGLVEDLREAVKRRGVVSFTTYIAGTLYRNIPREAWLRCPSCGHEFRAYVYIPLAYLSTALEDLPGWGWSPRAACPRCGFVGISYIHMLPSRKALEIARQGLFFRQVEPAEEVAVIGIAVAIPYREDGYIDFSQAVALMAEGEAFPHVALEPGAAVDVDAVPLPEWGNWDPEDTAWVSEDIMVLADNMLRIGARVKAYMAVTVSAHPPKERAGTRSVGSMVITESKEIHEAINMLTRSS